MDVENVLMMLIVNGALLQRLAKILQLLVQVLLLLTILLIAVGIFCVFS